MNMEYAGQIAEEILDEFLERYEPEEVVGGLVEALTIQIETDQELIKDVVEHFQELYNDALGG